MKIDKNFPVKPEVKKKRKNHYVDKHLMNEEILKFKETGQVSNELGKMISDISSHFARHPQFRRYQKLNVQEELIGEGIIACLKALRSYNPKRGDHTKKPNPVAYMTEVCKNAFKAYLIKHYKHENFQRDLIADRCHAQGIPFTDEIKKDMIERKENGELSNEEMLKKYFVE